LLVKIVLLEDNAQSSPRAPRFRSNIIRNYQQFRRVWRAGGAKGVSVTKAKASLFKKEFQKLY